MDIILKPDSLSLTGSMNHFIISSTQEVTFILKYAESNEIIVQHTYTPNKAKRIEIDLENIVTPLLSFQLQESTTIYRQPNIAREFLVNLIEDKTAAQESWQFTVLRAGIDNFADTASDWLKRNFLTWQPTVKPVTYYTPEFLSYYAVEDCVAKCRAYVEENGSYVQSDLVLGNLSHGKVWTMPMQYGVIAGKLGKMPSYYDVWVEDAAGTRLTYIQRYYASDIRSEEEQWVLFENSLGGIDTFRAYGDAENTAKHTHNVAEIENDSEEYRVDTVREYKKNTGFLSKEERKWLLDFFPSLGKFLYTGNYVRRIVVTESDVSWQTKDLPSSYTFTYKYADARPYLNITRSEDAAPAMLDIKIPDVGSFTIAPRLVELERLPLSSGALFPVQSPYSDKWNITTAEAILEWFSREVTAAYKGDGAFGHRHDNMSVLNALDRIGGYLTLDAQKILAGLADEAKSARSLDPKSVDWEKIVRTDQDTIVNSLTTFMKGIVFGKSVRGESGISIYQDEEGNWHLDAEYLHVHRKLTAEEVEIMKTSQIKGKVVNSAGGFVISKIERIVRAWRCYFRQEDADGRRIYNSMRVDDLALCETFNLIDAGGQLSNHYWHRRVIAVGTDYVDIADNTNVDDYASGSDTPQVGDEVVQLGHLTDEERQSAIIQSAAGEGAPYFKIIKGINSFILPHPIFLFDKKNFEIRVENPSRQGEYIRLQDYLSSMQSRIDSVKEQTDHQFLICFGDAIPTLTNEPANEWTDDETKEMHLHDLYYNRSYAETGGGRSYSFEKNPDGTFTWKEITDADVLKSLEAAKHAQDTADGKRRVFVQAVPVPPYDAGDQWTNATFQDKYNNDLLVCVRSKVAGEEFSIEDWQSAQHYTTKQFEAEFNVGGKSISAVVKDLRTGLEKVGMHLDGENSTFDIVANRFKVVTTTGKVSFITEAGKLSTDLIDAKQIVTEGLRTGDIDAQNATIKNIVVSGNSWFKGNLDGVSGSFKVLKCLNSDNEAVGGIYFEDRGSQAIMAMEGDLGMRKYIEGKFRKRLPRFYAKDVWCQGQFGHYAKICAVIKDDIMYVHHGGHIETNGVKVQLPTLTVKSGGRDIVCYKIPLYAPGYHGADGDNGIVLDVDNPALQPGLTDFYREIPFGAPIDMVIFNCETPHSYVFFGMGYGKDWVAFNGNDNVGVYVCDHREIRKLDGGWISHYLYVNPLWLTPTKTKETPGAGVLYTGTVDFDW
uniref:Tail protein n=1 Tax=Siphoviridae sp. ctSOk3 TaxID=2826342 RepID=A0A8S5NAH9_9CAUD|nr:MAG TPA: Putative tail protein [Siphoviridae sp. ctSOk3]